jgi:23S rRNA (uracil1939-C5)-methyltransferase
VKAGERLELRVEKAVYRGLGLARHEGRVVFVPGTYGGERVSVSVEEVGKGFARARLERLLEASNRRRVSPCRYSERCGGCAYQELEYEEQLRVKLAILRESLQRARVAWDAEIPLLGSPERGWRTRARLHVDWEGERPRLGFHEEGTQILVDVEECLQLGPSLERAARSLLAALAARGPLGRRVRGLELAESGDASERAACLLTDLSVREAASLSAVADEAPGLTGVLAAAGGEDAPTALVLRGSPYVHAVVSGIRFRGHQQSFFQANRFLVEPLVETVLRHLPAGGPVLDLYSGVGLFSLPLARRGDAVRAAELHPLAAADAVASAEAAALRVRVFAKDVESALRELPAAAGERVLLDPPRSGASRLAVRGIAERRPRSITYVSCDPPTLGRDVQLLAAAGYRLVALEALDMFPDTFHVEAVAQLERD